LIDFYEVSNAEFEWLKIALRLAGRAWGTRLGPMAKRAGRSVARSRVRATPAPAASAQLWARLGDQV